MKHLPAVAFFGFLCWIIYLADSALPSVFFDLVRNIPGGDKLGHFGLFGTLAWLLNRSLGFRAIRLGRWRLPLGATLVLAFAAVEEFSQLAFPNRTFDLVDLTADACGVLVFSLVQRRLRARLDRHSEAHPAGRAAAQRGVNSSTSES